MISLSKFFRSQPDPREVRRPLWDAVVATARAPHWYAQGTVPDTLDGRFDMVSLVLALVLHRIDDDPAYGLAGVQLTELFVNDLDGQMRQIGFGDMADAIAPPTDRTNCAARWCATCGADKSPPKRGWRM